MRQLHVLGDRLRSALWPIPTLAAALAAGLAVTMAVIGPEAADTAAWWPSDPAEARGLLEVLAGSSLTVVALVFSLHVVALQLAASQYSPRLLRTYARDWVIQSAMAVLIATFVFCLVTLAAWAGMPTTPGLSVVVAVLLGMASIAALVGVVAHIVTSLRVETLMAGIHEDTAPVVDAVLGAAQEAPPDATGSAGVALRAPRAGFVQAVDRNRIARWAQSHDAEVVLEVPAGAHVLVGETLGHARAAREDVDTEPVLDAILVGHERTPEEDPGFGVAQLVDIAARSLGMVVNDPTTARHAIGHITTLLLRVCDCGPVDARVTRDSDGTVRVWQPVPGLCDYLQMVIGPLARAGGGEPEVVQDLARLLGTVAQLRPDSAQCVREQAEYLGRWAGRGLEDDVDKQAAARALAPLIDR